MIKTVLFFGMCGALGIGGMAYCFGGNAFGASVAAFGFGMLIGAFYAAGKEA
jgi:hypothetical protein